MTVGNAIRNFLRLLDAVDLLAGSAAYEGLRPVFVQAGHNADFRPLHCESRPFLSMDEFQWRMGKADLIISHGGAATLLHAIRLGKVPVVMPRRKKYDEHVNDHQLQLVETLAAEGMVSPAYEPVDLAVAIAKARARNRSEVSRPPARMTTLVAQAIGELTKGKS